MARVTPDEINEVMAVIETIKGLGPVLQRVVDLAVDEIGPELGRGYEALRHGVVEARIRSIRQYEEAGLSRSEAIILTVDQKVAASPLVSGLMAGLKK